MSHDRKPSGGRHSRLASISREVLQGTRHVAVEGDRLFVGAARSLEAGAERTKADLAAIGRYVATESSKLRSRWKRGQRPRERIRLLLHEEARRAKLRVPKKDWDEFSERMATFLELVITGAVGIDAIAFESSEEADVPSTMHPCSSERVVNQPVGGE